MHDCPKCHVSCRTEKRLINHYRNEHIKVDARIARYMANAKDGSPMTPTHILEQMGRR